VRGCRKRSHFLVRILPHEQNKWVKECELRFEKIHRLTPCNRHPLCQQLAEQSTDDGFQGVEPANNGQEESEERGETEIFSSCSFLPFLVYSGLVNTEKLRGERKQSRSLTKPQPNAGNGLEHRALPKEYLKQQGPSLYLSRQGQREMCGS